MLKFDISIFNPLTKFGKYEQWNYDKVTQKYLAISKNKILEYSFGNPWANKIFGFSIDLQWSGSDHAGPEIEFCLLGWEFTASIHDNRHWNYEANRWNLEDEY